MQNEWLYPSFELSQRRAFLGSASARGLAFFAGGIAMDDTSSKFEYLRTVGELPNIERWSYLRP